MSRYVYVTNTLDHTLLTAERDGEDVHHGMTLNSDMLAVLSVLDDDVFLELSNKSIVLSAGLLLSKLEFISRKKVLGHNRTFIRKLITFCYRCIEVYKSNRIRVFSENEDAFRAFRYRFSSQETRGGGGRGEITSPSSPQQVTTKAPKRELRPTSLEKHA